ncbi:MAG: 16S rRNA (uracil(1498)-N(3))-methyltransferase [Planctomycetaceae bacterium]|nr:16S rRNA (uracil(1498)-N(3))-methyltransferase [Planctomycetaceae bacterium]
MSRRFYLPQSFEAPTLSLQGSEAHHLSRVLRLKAGDEVILFDGQGQEARARIEALADDRVELTVCERRAGRNESAVALTLAVAVPKGDRFDWLVEKATELGVTRLVPLITSRSVVDPRAGKLDRLRRTIVEASKQCGRSRLMELTAPTSWTDFVEQDRGGGGLWVADPSGESLSGRGLVDAGVVTGAVGPEGGFTPDELELACRHGARLISLGPRILRIETAALTLAVLASVTRIDN